MADHRPATCKSALPSMDPIGKQIGDYILRTKISDGATGSVYAGEHIRRAERVAIEVLHEETSRDGAAVEKFFADTRAAAAVGDPHVVEIHGCGRHVEAGKPDLCYVVMELLPGRRLKDAAASLSAEEALHIARQCCEALAACHERGVLHLGLGPESILLVEKAGDPLFVKIVHFGVAGLLAGAAQPPGHPSPEQCDAALHVDQRSDLYSLGAIIHEMLAGRHPLVGARSRGVSPSSPNRLGVGRALESVVVHALESNRDRRFPSMRALAAALASPEAHLASYERPTAPAIPSRMRSAPAGAAVRIPSKRWRFPIALGVIALVGFGIAAALDAHATTRTMNASTR